MSSRVTGEVVARATERLRHWGFEQATESLLRDVLEYALAEEPDRADALARLHWTGRP